MLLVKEEYVHLAGQTSIEDSVRFGAYLLDRRTGELRKHGLKIKLSGQPLEVLLCLLERPGELVTREELRQRLWADNVFVDFERSLNSAIRKLRRALNDDPQQPRYIETHPRKGYRFIGSLQETAVDSGVSTSLNTGPAPTRAEASASDGSHAVVPTPSNRSKWPMIFAAAAVLLLSSFLIASRFGRQVQTFKQAAAPGAVKARSSIAVLGFKNLSPHRDDEWLSTAITQMLSTELAGGDKVRIIPDEIVSRAMSDLNLKTRDSYARDTLRDLRAHVGSDYVVAGSYMAVGDKNRGELRMNLHLQEAISGETLTSIAVSGKQPEILELVARAGREMRTKLGSSVAPEGDVDWRMVLPSNPQAAKLYSQGLAHLRVSDNLLAADLFERSLAIEPDFALGHAAIADAWAGLGYDSRALLSAQKAFSLSNDLPEDERMEIQGRYYELNRDWPGAMSVYRHLFQDFPDDLESGLKLVAAATEAGELDDALAVLSNLRALPVPQRDDPRIDLAEASIAARNRDYERQKALAEEAAREAKSSGSRVLLARAKLVEGWAFTEQSHFREAAEAYSTAQQSFEQAGDRDGTGTALNDLGIVLEKQGDLAGALAKLEEALTIFRQIGDQNGLGTTLTSLSEIYRAEGDLTRSESLRREALDISRKVGHGEDKYATTNNVGGALDQNGDSRGPKPQWSSKTVHLWPPQKPAVN